MSQILFAKPKETGGAQVESATVKCNHKRLHLASITWITQVKQVTVLHMKFKIKHKLRKNNIHRYSEYIYEYLKSYSWLETKLTCQT